MYLSFYGLKEHPFNVTCDPAFFFPSRKHQEALSHLTYGVRQRRGIIVITGEIGAGKTTLCRYLLNHLRKGVKTAIILNPLFSDIELLQAILKDFGLPARTTSRLRLTEQLNRFLIRESSSGNNVVLIIDEAQHLHIPQLEQVRLLSNLETEKHKLLQIVLVGQPELNQKLNSPALRQLQQRIMVRYHIGTMDKDEVAPYLSYRLRVAGCLDKATFTPEAAEAIAEFSCGRPRLINIIGDRALLAGFVQETPIIGSDIIQRCIQELQPYFMEEEVRL